MESSSGNPFDVVVVYPQLHQGGRQALRDGDQVVPGEVQLLQVIQWVECPGVDLGDPVVDQSQGLGGRAEPSRTEVK